MRNKKKLISVLSAFVMAMTLLAVPAVSARAGAEDASVVVTMPVTSEPASGFDPAFGWGAGEHVHEPLIQSTLVRTNKELEVQSMISPCLRMRLQWMIQQWNST